MRDNKQLMQKRRDAMIASGEMTESQWYALEQVFPGAKPETKVMAWEYCKARKLDPFKRVVHAVPMPVTDSETGKTEWRDVIMPGIAELRTTAHRTGKHAGLSSFTYGPIIKFMGLEVPEFCEVTVYRMIGGTRCEFPGRVEFAEACQTTKDKQTGQIRLNRFWHKTPRLMMRKCCEADALRRAFPEELGAEFTAEEIQNAPIDTQYQVEPKAAAEQAMNGDDLGEKIAAKTDDEVLDSVFTPANQDDLGKAIADEINEDLAKKKAPRKRGRKPTVKEQQKEIDEFKQQMDLEEGKTND